MEIMMRKTDTNIVPQRIKDGYVNATAMCRACGKQINDYIRLNTTKAYFLELSSDTGIPVSGLLEVIKGGIPELQGTWVHPQAAMHLGQWLSPKFAVLVSKWVLEWLSGTMKPNMPYHLVRYLANAHKVPYGYFSMLNELTLALISPMEAVGYILPARMLPDASVGKMFSRYLRERGYPVDSYPKYLHEFEDGRIVEARAYPNELIGEMRKYFVEVWLTERAHDYFLERDPAALPCLERFLKLPSYNVGHIA